MLNFRHSYHGHGVPEEANDEHERNNDGISSTFTTRSGPSGNALGTTHSVQFNNFQIETKDTEAMNVELDTVRSEGEVVCDDIEVSGEKVEATPRPSGSGRPGKRRDFAEE
ncbi:hypothetical protein BC628DRAFT_712665 [Trametes gibbosa]|nr:hypothetical protein BC628DRAFT_712665 [Trametes gibbosa]